AENGNTTTALAKAKKAYDYIVKAQGTETLSVANQLLNLSEVHYLTGNYGEALNYSNRSLAVLNTAIRSGISLLDSVRTELKKPKAILQKTKAEYSLLKTKSKADLSRLLAELAEALVIIERRKTILNDVDDIGLLMADQSELVKFMEKINIDLYKLTNDRSYLHKLIGLHESALYNRIRSRLDKADTLQFAHVPSQVLAKERSLKAAITTALEGDDSHHQKMQAYFSAVDAWNRFEGTLKKDYPRYYQLRYASIFKSLDGVRQMIPANTTLVRYFFSDKELFAFVADAKSENIISLGVQDIEKKITSLSARAYDVAAINETLAALYQQLWAPIEGLVQNKKVVIIPDGILYNLSFETLTPKKITSFKELATNSLLAKHSIAYHYSLFLVGQKKQPASNTASFVAFAPGFMDDMKQPYRTAAAKSPIPDNNYLSLLPQPFTIDLAARTQKLFGGDAFLHGESTVNSFRQNAANHKIIHIGTHAESDNLHPEYSRLIFAKTGGGDDNYL
ncbi:MAG TPA: CHAT domain-containing protein, partial [Flavisolibacter sp.]